MNNYKNRFSMIKTAAAPALFAALSFLILAAAGCGGGGGGAASSAAPATPGFGRVSASVKFPIPASAARAAGATGSSTETVKIDVSITGYYAENGKSFATVTTSLEIPATGGHGQAAILNVPIGTNHLLTAVATWPGGSTETIKAIIPQVSEGKDTNVAADTTSTIVAEIALYLAARDNKILPDITQDQLAQITSAVQSLVASNVDPSTLSVNDILNYGPESSIPTSIQLTPTSMQIGVGFARHFTAVVKNKFGGTLGTTATWSVSNTQMGTIDQTGLFTATAIGDTIVTATTGTLTATASVTVTTYNSVSDAPASITITPATTQIGPGYTQQFTANVKNSSGAIIGETAAWTLSSTSGTIGAINPATGLFTASALGDGVITAATGTVSATASVTVIANPVASIKLMDAPGGTGNAIGNLSKAAGDSVDMFAVGYDALNQFVTDIDVTWTMSANIGYITPLGQGGNRCLARSGRTACRQAAGSGVSQPPVTGASATLYVFTAGQGAINAVSTINNLTANTGLITVAMGPVTYLYMMAPSNIAPYPILSTPYEFTVTGYDNYGNSANVSRNAVFSSLLSATPQAFPNILIFSEIGDTQITATYNAITSNMLALTIVEPPPSVSNPGGFSNLTFGQPLSVQFTTTGGTAPFTWLLVGGVPPNVTIDSTTGLLSGTAPDYISTWHFYVRVTDAHGRSTDNSNPNNITDASVDLTIDISSATNDLINIFTTADGGLTSMTNLLAALREIAIQAANGSPDNNAYHASLNQFDAVAASTSYNSPLLTNGPILLNGAYSETPIDLNIAGGNGSNSPIAFSTYLDNYTSSALGVQQCVSNNSGGWQCGMDNSPMAGQVANSVDTAVVYVSEGRAIVGDMNDSLHTILDINNHLINSPFTGACNADLTTLTTLTGNIKQIYIARLNTIKGIVAQAANGTTTTDMLSAWQAQINEILGTIDISTFISTYGNMPLFDGALNVSCNGGAPVTEPLINISALGINNVCVIGTCNTDPAANQAALDAAIACLNGSGTCVLGQGLPRRAGRTAPKALTAAHGKTGLKVKQK